MQPQKGTYTNPADGKVYKTVKIGDQIWMAENLNVSNYLNGDQIPEVYHKNKWGEITTGGWCHYDNEIKNEAIYGKLYNWHAVNDQRGLAPDGWHIPSDTEWKALESYLELKNYEADNSGWRGKYVGDALKETGIAHWKAPNDTATNSTRFTALPGGYRDVSGLFYVIGHSGYWWSSTRHKDFFAWYRSIYHSHREIHRTSGYEGDGFSVRCIKDTE